MVQPAGTKASSSNRFSVSPMSILHMPVQSGFADVDQQMYGPEH
jgi:hypothetical protein